MKPTITVLICTLNEAENIPSVLPKIPAWVDEVLLVDGHSSDNTIVVAKKLRSNIIVLNQVRTGKDNAMMLGVQQAKGDIIITLDADGSNDPTEMQNFIDPLLNGYDFVKSSRFLLTHPRAMPWHRCLGNRMLCWQVNLLFGTKFTDVCSGYNAFWKKAWDRMVYPTKFGYEPLILIKAKRAGLKIYEITTHDKGRINGKSKLPSLQQGWGAFKAILIERFSSGNS